MLIKIFTLNVNTKIVALNVNIKYLLQMLI